ncbi:MAG TPA: outer membrane protein transport protein [Thermoanaerobaculia bacterium]|nr:outer membrane protein transport protein [Thermoanaerobaculia bacterium]
MIGNRSTSLLATSIAFLAITILLTSTAFATTGYFSLGQGTGNIAMGGAGVAFPLESLSATYNPASAAFLPAGYSVGIALFSPDRSYTVTGKPSGFPGTFGLTPGKVTSKSKYFPMPSVGMNFRLDNASAVNISLVSHGGMNTDYRTDTFYGSGGHTGVDLAQAFVYVAYSRKIAEKHSLGVSGIVAYQRFKATGLQAFSPFSSNPAHLTNNGYDSSHGFGFKVGYLGYITPDLSIGASYAPKITMSRFKKYSGLFAEGGKFDVPSVVAVGLAYSPVKTLTIASDYKRIHYTDAHSVGNPLLPNLMTALLGADGGAGFGWRDINVYKIGMQYQPGHDWIWRLGFSTNDQPIPDSEVLFNILAPGVIEHHYTAGFSKVLGGSRARVNFAVMYAPTATVRGANPLEAPGQQRIDLKLGEWQAEVSYSVGF